MRSTLNKTQDYKSLVSQYGSPLLILDTSIIKEQYNLFKQCLPGVEVCFAIKCLNHPEMLKTLRDLGGSFDVATNGEIDLLTECEVSPSRCIHTHPIKKDHEIKRALEFGITSFVVDNECEI